MSASTYTLCVATGDKKFIALKGLARAYGDNAAISLACDLDRPHPVKDDGRLGVYTEVVFDRALQADSRKQALSSPPDTRAGLALTANR